GDEARDEGQERAGEGVRHDDRFRGPGGARRLRRVILEAPLGATLREIRRRHRMAARPQALRHAVPARRVLPRAVDQDEPGHGRIVPQPCGPPSRYLLSSARTIAQFFSECSRTSSVGLLSWVRTRRVEVPVLLAGASGSAASLRAMVTVW